MRKQSWIIYAALVVLVVLLAYGQTLRMYFWQDDFALIFKLQHPAGPAGSFGSGIIGDGAYKYLVTPFVPFFSLFGLNPFFYFLVGLLLYLLDAYVFWLFSSEFLQNRKWAYFCTLAFSAGYIGSEIMFRVINSWQSNIGIFLTLFTFFVLVKYSHTKKNVYYFFGVLFYWACLEFVYVRSHSLIFPILLLNLFTVTPFSLKKLVVYVVKQIPFMLLFYGYYLHSESATDIGISSFFQSLLQGRFWVLSSLLATTGKALVPDFWIDKFISIFAVRTNMFMAIVFFCFMLILSRILGFSKKVTAIGLVIATIPFFVNKYFVSAGLYWYKSQSVMLSTQIAVYVIAIVAFTYLVLWKKRESIFNVAIFGLIVILSQIYGYFVHYQDAIFGSTHRYLNYTLIGYSLLWGSIIFVLSRRAKYLSPILLGLVLLPNLFFGYRYQSTLVKERSLSTANFYQSLKKYYPSVPKGSIFYFDTAEDPLSRRQFYDFFSVGSMPDTTAIAVFYDLDRNDIKRFTEFDELLSYLAHVDSGEVENVYSFYYSSGAGLVDTTVQMRSLLRDGGQWQQLYPQKASNNLSIARFQNISLTPLVLTFKAKTSFLKQLSSPVVQNDHNLRLTIDYLLSRKEYYSSVKVLSQTEWKYREVENAADGNMSTCWQGNRINWHDNKSEWLTVDLGRKVNTSRLVWINCNQTLSPTEYTIEVSLDGNNWREVKKVSRTQGAMDMEVVTDDFSDIDTRYVRMNFASTLSGDSPSVAEIEVVPQKYSLVDYKSAIAFAQNPFNASEENLIPASLYSLIAPLLNIRIVRVTNDGDIRQSFVPVGSFDSVNTYSLVLVPGGTNIDSIEVGIPDSMLNFDIYDMKIQAISIAEAQSMGVVRRFSNAN